MSARMQIREQVLATLYDEGSLKARQIASKSKLGKSRVHNATWRLKRDGLIQQTHPRGEYTLTDKGTMQAAEIIETRGEPVEVVERDLPVEEQQELKRRFLNLPSNPSSISEAVAADIDPPRPVVNDWQARYIAVMEKILTAYIELKQGERSSQNDQCNCHPGHSEATPRE